MNICILGGAGYVGTELTRYLLDKGHNVDVLDLFWFGDHLRVHPNLLTLKGDIRKKDDIEDILDASDTVIHLACVSNDPSFEMQPKLGKSINLDCFKMILECVRKSNVNRFIYASSSSVYGIHETDNVTEKTECRPLTDYSKFKLECENILKNTDMGLTNWTIVRPATVCGFSPRMRFDLVVNIMTACALWDGKIKVHGGKQLRPNIHIKDMIRAYETIMLSDTNGETFNVGFENHSLLDIAIQIADLIPDADIVMEESKDPRSYHVNSDKIEKVLGFKPIYSIRDAVIDIYNAKAQGYVDRYDSKTEYSNIKKMQELINEGQILVP